MKYRKKPIVIEALQWLGDWQEMKDWAKNCSDGNGTDLIFMFDQTLKVQTLEGEMKVPIGNFVVCGVEGEFYSCDPEIFKKSNEPVE